MNNLNTPILFLIFNRPDNTSRVFAEIKKTRPKKLFIAADGARKDKEGEQKLCDLTRKTVIENIDWDCEVKTLFREENMGCGKAVSSAITWFFQNVEQGIILEDDCLPHPDFFPFCEELLNKYKDNEKILHISSNNYQDGVIRGDGSYFFSENVEIWGWATWKRTWNKYKFSLEYLDDTDIFNTLKNTSLVEENKKHLASIFLKMKNKMIDTWDYQYVYTILSNKGICIMPNVNLVSNIGFGENSTHTKENTSIYANCEVYPIMPLIHPTKIQLNTDADKYFYQKYLKTSFSKKFLNKIKNIIKILFKYIKPK